MTVETTPSASFTEFVSEAEPRLRRALCVAFGRDLGLEATAEALAWGWEHWDRMRQMQNPTGYLYRVGQSRIRAEWRRRSRRATLFDPVDPNRLPWVEPGLPRAMAALSERQRLAVGLVHGFGWSQQEVADMVHVSPGTIKNHLDRGMSKLRSSLGVEL
jgi:DNA-directed RNA polymerase specialized sigma24 family protein